MKYLIFLIIGIGIVLFIKNKNSHNLQYIQYEQNNPTNTHITHSVYQPYFEKTRCFSCEKQMPESLKHISSPSKCFSCEAQLIRTHGPNAAKFGKATKCFSCQ